MQGLEQDTRSRKENNFYMRRGKGNTKDRIHLALKAGSPGARHQIKEERLLRFPIQN